MPKASASVKLDLAIAFPNTLRSALQQRQVETELSEDVRTRLNGLLSELGIPAELKVRVAEQPKNRMPFTLLINGKPCRHDEELFLRVHSSLLHMHRTPEMSNESVRTWAHSLVTPDISGRQRFVQFVSLACEEMLKRRPSLLLASAQAIRYRELLARHCPDVPDPEWLQPVLAELLDLRLSLVDTAKVALTLRETHQKRNGRDEIVETLISSLQPDEIEIRLAPGYLRTLTETDKASTDRIFALMREGLFYELGVVFPDFKFLVDERLSPGTFTFRINNIVTLPRVGLAPGEILTTEEPGRLTLLGLQVLMTITHPVSQGPASVVRQQDAATAEAERITTWTPLGFLVLCLSAELRRYAAALLNEEAVRNVFNDLSPIFPDLIAVARERLSIPQLTRVLRELLSEEVSVRDLRLILQAILECDYVIADESALIIFDERIALSSAPPLEWRDDPVVLATSARRALKRYLSHKYSRGASSLNTYLLDPQIERRVAAHGSGRQPMSDEEIDHIVQATQSAIKGWSGPGTPPVLTSTEARRPFRDIMGQVFPRLPVVAYQELAPETNITPIVRISL